MSIMSQEWRGLLDTEPYGCLPAMPHYKSGLEAKLFDRVKLRTGTRTVVDGGTEPIFSEGVVLAIEPGATCCELKVFIPNGPVEVLSMGTMYQKRPPSTDLKGEPIMWHIGFVSIGPGYVTQTNASDCEVLPHGG